MCRQLVRQRCLQELGFHFCLLCGPLHGYQEGHFLRSTCPCGPKSGSQTTSEINVQNDITLPGNLTGASADSSLCSPLHDYQEEHWECALLIPYEPKYIQIYTIHRNQRPIWISLTWILEKYNDIALKSGIANLERSHRLPRVFNDFHNFPKTNVRPIHIWYCRGFCGGIYIYIDRYL